MTLEVGTCGASLATACTDHATCKTQLVKHTNLERGRKGLETLAGTCQTDTGAAEDITACNAAAAHETPDTQCAAENADHGCVWTALDASYNTLMASAVVKDALTGVGATIVQNLACATAADDNTATQIFTDLLKADVSSSAAETLATLDNATEAALINTALLACMASDTAGTGRAAEITTVVNTMVDSCHTTASDGTETTKQPLCEAHNYTEGTCTADETNSCSWTVATVTGLTASVKTQLPLTIAAAIEARANASPASALSTFTVLVATMYALFN